MGEGLGEIYAILRGMDTRLSHIEGRIDEQTSYRLRETDIIRMVRSELKERGQNTNVIPVKLAVGLFALMGSLTALFIGVLNAIQ